MENLSYIASLLAIFFGICAPFWKKIRMVLLCNFMTNLMTGLSYLFVGGLSGAAIAFVGGIQLFINHMFMQKQGKVPAYMIAIHVLTFIVADVLMYQAWYDVLILTSSILFVVSTSQTSTKYYRFLYFFNNMLMIFYDIFAKAYGNLAMHIVLLSAAVFAILVRDMKKEKPET